MLDGNTVTINGKNFAGTGMWCDASYAKRNLMCTEGLLNNHYTGWHDGLYIFDHGKRLNTYDFYMRQEDFKANQMLDTVDVDVMISHFGPYAHNIRPEYNNLYTGFFYFDGSRLMQKMKPDSLWLFGHTHDTVDIVTHGIRLVCNPIGYPGERKNPKIITLEI
jgi:hypothetical protein